MSNNAEYRPLPKRWRVHYPIPNDISQELSEFSPLLRQLLYNRGYQDAEAAAAFIEGRVPFDRDPFLLKGMEAAVERLHQAVVGGEKVAVYGDYDVDGVTSTALMVEFLTGLGVEVRPYIPDRFDEGYGLNDEAMRTLAGEGIALVITVDCGVRAVGEVGLANELGMDVIISDHHHPGSKLPPALAVIDPKQVDDIYPENTWLAWAWPINWRRPIWQISGSGPGCGGLGGSGGSGHRGGPGAAQGREPDARAPGLGEDPQDTAPGALFAGAGCRG